MKIEDKAYFLFDTPGMSQKEKDKRAKYWLALEKQQAKKAMEDWRFAVAQEERYMGSVFVTPVRQREMEARTQAAYLKAKKLNPDYQGFSMPVEDKSYFAVSPAETEKKIRDLTAAWRKLMNVADNLHGMANPSPEIIKRQDQVDADMERIGDQIAELKKSIGVKENVSVRLAKPVEDKAYFARQGSKAKFAKEYILWALPKGSTDRLDEKVMAEGLYTPAQVDDVKRRASADGWHSFRVVAMMSFDDMTNAFKGKGIKKGSSRAGFKTNFEHNLTYKIALQESNNPPQIYKITREIWKRIRSRKELGYFNSREIIEKALATGEAVKMSRTGTKSKFANRGAFAEASSSPVLGSLLEKKVMPEGGWRAVETDGAALVIAFEDGDIAGNFARRASENGYSATAPMAMAGRFWNVKVQNENVEVEKQLNFKKKTKFGFNTWTEKDTLTLREMTNEVQDLRTNSYAKKSAWNELGFMCNKILDICYEAFAAKDSDMIQIIKSKIKQVKDQTKKTK